MMRLRTAAFSAILVGALFVTAVRADDKAPDATIELSGGSVAAGIGFSWGSGTLTYKGKQYPISVKGFSAGSVGATSVTAKGNVYDLKQLSDFNGNYTAVGAGMTIAGGGSAIAMRNQNGVSVNLVTTTAGVSFSLAVSGVDLALKD